MAKEEKVEKAAKSPEEAEREARWEAFLAAHKKQNPEKHAAREKAGELKMPANF